MNRPWHKRWGTGHLAFLAAIIVSLFAGAGRMYFIAPHGWTEGLACGLHLLGAFAAAVAFLSVREMREKAP